MRLKLNEFFDDSVLIGAKNLVLGEISEHIKIEIKNRQINVDLDSIPDSLQDEYQTSNVIEFNKHSGRYFGSITRIRLNHDLVTGIFAIYDYLIFTDRYRIEDRDIAMLKDIMEIVDKEDYCVQNLPEIIDKLKEFTKFQSIEAEVIVGFEKANRVKVPKRPIFYRIPFLVWIQQQKGFYVPDENIVELVY